ncbi:MAG: hypothetical protein O7G83_12630 [Proteobacteria bacterium]|nr:hypothetical protein [Pseudomonadota bacterium]
MHAPLPKPLNAALLLVLVLGLLSGCAEHLEETHTKITSHNTTQPVNGL